jgi:hypothetical protein
MRKHGRQQAEMASSDIFSDAFGVRMAVFIDTEEEFDWDDDFSRHEHAVSSVPALRDGQKMFDGAGLTPCYLVDTPILQSATAVDILGLAAQEGRCDIGAHLHPWVTPPFDEVVSRRNSYAGNLPQAMERMKIRHVRDLILQRLDHNPRVYRAGRYGIGPNTLAILHDEGFACDTSVRPYFDYRDDGGPDFRWSGLNPSWVGPDETLIELPLTSIFVGRLGRLGKRFYGWSGATPSVRSLAARSNLIERIPLTPEGIPADKACRAIDVACDMGVRLLNFSFHSPSLAIGHTPYVRDAADLAAFYRWWDIVFAHCHRRGIQPASVDDILNDARAHRAAQSLPA